jgi:hypothetical protein
MTAIESQLADLLIEHQLDILRLEAGVRAQVLQLLTRMQRELAAQLQSGTLSDFSKARTQALLREATAAIDTYYTRIAGELDTTLRSVAQVQANASADAINTVFVASVEAALPTETFLKRIVSNVLIMGAPSADWWSKQSTETAFRFSNAVRQGIAQGQTNEQIVARIVGRGAQPGIMEVSRKNARALVHTSIQAVANESRRETFRQNANIVEGIRQISTLDSHTTDICIAYSDAEWDLDGNPINGTTLPYNGGVPRHWGCRSVEAPITKSFAELGLDIPEPKPGERASAAGPVPADMTFDAFLKRRGKPFQDEVLGPGRADLWRRKVITLQQLLDLKGNPLTLRQLEERYA